MCMRIQLPHFTVLLVASCLSISAYASRTEPTPVTPVTIAGIEYRAPAGNVGFVEAHDAKSGNLLWSRQIYVVVKNFDLEKDVQDVFISKIEPSDDALTITNESGSIFSLDLKSLEVKTVKGSTRVEPTAKKMLVVPVG